jgi:hypothetical protein
MAIIPFDRRYAGSREAQEAPVRICMLRPGGARRFDPCQTGNKIFRVNLMAINSARAGMRDH